jgi:hypothetical protein
MSQNDTCVNLKLRRAGTTVFGVRLYQHVEIK